MDAIVETLQELFKLTEHKAFLRTLQFSAAVISVLTLMQGIKWAVRAVWPTAWHPKVRAFMLALCSFYFGYRAGHYFIDGEYTKQWAMFIAVFNPALYFVLVQYATVKDKIILLSFLKLRPVVERNGKWQLHDTQTFMAPNKK